MKKFLIKICVFFAIIFLIDVFVGRVLSYMVANAKDGDFRESNYICNESRDDILIFGSSRSARHYNPQIISDSLGMTCYNCGQDGMGVILNYGRYELHCQKHRPKLVIYDILPAFDLLENDNHKYLKWLMPYYDKSGILDIFEAVDFTEKVKMLSMMYRYNSIFFNIIANYIPTNSVMNIGFRPLDVSVDTIIVNEQRKESVVSYDSVKISFLNKMIELSKETDFVFVVSPIFYNFDTTSLELVKKMCHEKRLEYIDFSNHPKYNYNNDFFMDCVHLNAKGADEFSRDLVMELKKRKII